MNCEDPNPPTVIFECVLGESTYPLVIRLLRAQMIGETIQYQAPNKVLLPPPPSSSLPSRTTALSVLQVSPLPASIKQLHILGRRFHIPDCLSANHTVLHLFNCPSYPKDLAPGDMWAAPLRITQFLAGLPQFANLPQQQIVFDSFPYSPGRLSLSRALTKVQVQVWAIGPRQELAPPPPSWIQHPARTNAPKCVCQKGTGLCFVLGGSRVGHSHFPPFQRWSQPGASPLDETPDLPLPAGDSLAAQGSKPRRSPLRHVEADHLPLLLPLTTSSSFLYPLHLFILVVHRFAPLLHNNINIHSYMIVHGWPKGSAI